uniref:Gfo/Idh/MocA family protein n=1 Tax=Yoonia sp. TaxID=2212373 RepID=UPI0035C80598
TKNGALICSIIPYGNVRIVLISEALLNRSALVVGYGSIGQRHMRRLAALGCDVGVCSRREVDVQPLFSTLTQALAEFAPDYVVLASQTHEHAGNLQDLASAGFTGSVLVEKPLFDHLNPLPDHQFAALNVAYNLRLHPLIARLREALAGQKICSFQVYVGQYLPTWRPGTDYRQSYSASGSQGGGVLRDLSHDLDYTIWLLGGWRHLTAQGGRVSDLEITSDDCFMVMMDTPRCPLVSLQLNYLDRVSRREILVNTKHHTIRVDLVAGSFAIDTEIEMISTQRDVTYDAMHTEMLSGNAKMCATAREGLDVMDLIAAIETASETRTWVSH